MSEDNRRGHRHQRTRRSQKEMEDRRRHDTKHEFAYKLEEGLPDDDDIVPTPDKTKTIIKAEDWSSSVSNHMDEESENSGSWSVSRGSSNSSGSSYSSERDASEDSWDTKDGKMGENMSDRSESEEMGKMSMRDRKKLERLQREVARLKGEEARADEAGESESENMSGPPPPSMPPPPPPQSNMSGSKRRHMEKRSESYEFSKGRGHDGERRMYKHTSSAARKGSSHGQSSRLPRGVSRNAESGRFQSNSSSSKRSHNDQQRRSSSYEQQEQKQQKPRNTDSSCHMHSKSKGQKRSGGSSSGNAQKEPKQPAASAGKTKTHVFDDNPSAWEQTTVKIHLRGTPTNLDKFANKDRENRIPLNLGNSGITVLQTTSEEMAKRLRGNSEKQKGSSNDEFKSNANSRGGKGGAGGNDGLIPAGGISTTFQNLFNERDLVGKVVALNGKSTYGHDLNWHLPNVVIPGHHAIGSAGEFVQNKGLEIHMSPHEEIHMPRTVAHARIDPNTTNYQQTYKNFPSVGHLRNETYEDEALKVQKIKYSKTEPHPVVDFFHEVHAKNDPKLVKRADIKYSADDKKFIMMNKDVFEDTLKAMQKHPNVLSKLNNMSDVSNMQAYVIPSETKGDVQKMMKDSEQQGTNLDSENRPQMESGNNATSSHHKDKRKFKKGTDSENMMGNGQGRKQPRSSGGKGDYHDGQDGDLSDNAPDDQKNEKAMYDAFSSPSVDLAKRSWVTASKSAGYAVDQTGSAYITLEIHSIPASKIKSLIKS